MKTHMKSKPRFLEVLALAAACCFFWQADANAWWDKGWEGRKPVVVDSGAAGASIEGSPSNTLVLLRLHQGNFDFASVQEGGADFRFIAEDDKTPLPYHIEKFDGLMNEAFVWVGLPDIQAGKPAKFFLYYGNRSEKAEAPPAAKETYDDATVLVYHFGASGNPQDATKNGNNATAGGAVSEGALIAAGLRAIGNTAVAIPASDSLKIGEGQALTWSCWIKATTLPERATIFYWGDDAARLEIGLAAGVPFAEAVGGGAKKKAQGTEALPVGVWAHLTFVSDGSVGALYVNGKEVGKMEGGLPAISGGATLGALPDGTKGAVGEIDEVEISKVARSKAWVQFAAVSQAGGDASAKVVAMGESEGGGGGGHGAFAEALEHLSLFGDIAKNMMFDGWVVIFCCCIMMVIGWSVAIKKFLYLGKIQKGGDEFLRQWKTISKDLTALDHSDAESVKSMGGKAGAKTQKLMHLSPLYHLYHIGSEEICHRLESASNNFQGLSARSIQAIKASLDSGLVHEVHRLNKGLIFLTISIAGGPYIGLLGTVMGVMITFAVIAKSGEVEVNSIAPGIASALLATVAGLVVAIPALFIYSYLSSQIKDTVSNMNIFIDEFITKMAEFYPENKTSSERGEK